MKLFVWLILISFTAQAQNIPEVKWSEAKPDKYSILPKLLEKSKYDVIISYLDKQSWLGGKHYKILRLYSGKWRLDRYHVSVSDKVKHLRPRGKKIHSDSIHAVLNFWKEVGFLELNTDSLNVRMKKVNDSTTLRYYVTDGNTEIFEMLTKTSYHGISAYMVDRLQLNVPVRQRAVFILGKQKFLRMVN
jgi:hypothetical protein